MKRAVLTALALAVAALAEPAAAHAPIAGIGSFWNGAVHPFLVPLHVMVILVLGVLMGQHAPHLSRLAWPVFMVALAGALLLAPAQSLPPAALPAAAMVGGLLVALGRALRPPVVLVALSGGVLIGLDFTPEGVRPGEAWLARAGTFAGAAVGLTLAGGLVAAMSRPWQRIAVRAAGSWIAAAAVLVLALSASEAKVWS